MENERVEEDGEFPEGLSGCLVAGMVGGVGDGDGGKEDPGMKVVEGGEVFLVCFGA